MDLGNSYLRQTPHIVTRNRKPCLACSLSKVKCNLISDQLCEHCARKGEVKCPPFVPNKMRKDVTSWMALVNNNGTASDFASGEPTMQGGQATVQNSGMSYAQYAGVDATGLGNWSPSGLSYVPIPTAPVSNPLPPSSIQGPHSYVNYIPAPQPQVPLYGIAHPDSGQSAPPMNLQLPWKA
ncbi:hypothetical protein SCHPADRAFT_302402 [Schizopora paradoxa]|uniref:Zn(2)-C6 fungal-type domain-containing protein n=1 Tax=Schizopora paradoxa TaxID=27342 RepID=A0A0H2RRS2_9AGAM|nr:hypothetical protein SCHPADRAFT_302402 [Schizopora paradoxa]